METFKPGAGDTYRQNILHTSVFKGLSNCWQIGKSVTKPGLAACHLKKKNQYWQKLVERKTAFNQNAGSLGAARGETVDSVFGHESSQGKKGSNSR